MIGIGITTRGRDRYLKRSLENHLKHLPVNAKIVVVDDGSEEKKVLDDQIIYFHFPENVGIPLAKNKCLELLDDCEHIFLFDDDIYPIVDSWHKPYVDSPEAHFQYCWSDIRPGKYGDQHYYSIGKKLYEDDKFFSFSHPRGQMLYIDAKKVLPRIGGFDPIYGKGMVEHVDWSWRIHNAGLSTWKNQDVVGSEKLFYSIDENANSEPDFETTIDDHMRNVIDKENQRILHQKADSSEYIEYRNLYNENVIPLEDQNNVVICGVFSGKPDFQINWGARHNSVPDPKYRRKLKISSAHPLLQSVRKHGERLVIINNLEYWPPMRHVEYVLTGCSEDPYKNRFLKALHYLIEHEEIDNAWIVDSGDVVMFNNPFPEMQPGKIYVGCETRNRLDCNWMLTNTPVGFYKNWLKKNGNKKLLNCGLIGGSRQDLIDYLTKMFFIWGYNSANMDLIDMLVFNVVGYEHFPDKIVFGEGLVNNVFKSEKATAKQTEWWLHK